METKDTTIAPQMAAPKFEILNPPTKSAVNQSKRALMTKVKRPKVTMLIGRVMRIKNGLIAKLSNPRMAEATTAADKLATVKPGMKLVATKRETVVTIR